MTLKQGDIVWCDFAPSSGRESIKRRPAFVLSRKMFNDHTGFAVVAPITSTLRDVALEVNLPEGISTKGTILVHQLKSLDLSSRQVKYIEHAPDDIIQKVKEIAKLIIS